MPTLEKLVDVCRSMDAWLRADKDNVIVVHCSVSQLVHIHIYRCISGVHTKEGVP